jgi:DUF4097 and DUF4098 domain-containing protein YvlB
MSSPTQTPQMPPPMPPRYYVRRRSIAGPIVLIALGVIFLLGNLHVLTWPHLAYYWARYWPVLIILWGAIKLYEHWSDTRQGLPGRGIGAGGVLLLIFLIIFGMSATAAYKVNWNQFSGDVGFDNDFAGLFGNTYNFTQTLQQPFAPGSSLRIVDDRGGVTVNTWDEPNIKVVVNKRIVASSDDDSRSLDSQTQAVITNGTPVVLDANTRGGGDHPVESNLQIWLPRKASLDVVTGRGDVNVATRDGNIQANASRGDLTFQTVNGNVTVSLQRGSVRAENIEGDVSVSGRVDDITAHDISGALALSGDFFGEMDLARIAKAVTFHSTRTDMEMASLPGDLDLQSGDLRARAVTGPLRIITRSKDIHLENVSGELKIENSNGLVEYHAGNKLGAIDISNSRGDVQLTLPPKSSFQVEANARRGDIQSDFQGVSISESHNEHSASGTVGSGGPHIQISDTNGDISLRQGDAPPPPENAGASQQLPPDKTITPGGGIRESTPPKAPKAPAAPPKKSRDMTGLQWHVGPHQFYFGPAQNM